MNKINSLTIIFVFLLLLNSGGTIDEGLGGSKKKSKDEFLVKKKAPLIIPPNFGELPEPGIKIDKNVSSTKENILSIEEIIAQNSSVDLNIGNKESNSSIEKSIIEKINEK